MRAAGFAPRALILVLLAGCEDGRPSPSRPSASKSANAPTPLTNPPPPAPAPAAEKTEVSLCRVIAVRPFGGSRNDAGASSSALPIGTALEGREWLELSDPVEVVLRHSATTRELALRGPGRFLPCFLGTETVLVARGGLKTTAGAGARAGAEVILATPFGTLHLADAALELRVGERDLETKVETGAATLVSAAPAGDAGAVELTIGSGARKKISGKVDVGALVGRCGEAAGPLGTPPPKPNDGVPSARARLGQWSVEQLRARQSARWACASARAAVGREEGAERDRRWAELSRLDRVWHTKTGTEPQKDP